MNSNKSSARPASHRRWEFGSIVVFASDPASAREIASIAEKQIECMGSEALASGKIGHWRRVSKPGG